MPLEACDPEGTFLTETSRGRNLCVYVPAT
jgi:hypothetical protein